MKIKTDRKGWNCNGCDGVNTAHVGAQTDLGMVWFCPDCLKTIAKARIRSIMTTRPRRTS